MSKNIRYGVIGKVSYNPLKASLIYPDSDNASSAMLTVLGSSYSPPRVGDTAVAVYQDNGIGFIVGINNPNRLFSGKGIFCKTFEDGSYIVYDSSAGELQTNIKNIMCSDLTCASLKVLGNLTVTGDTIVNNLIVNGSHNI